MKVQIDRGAPSGGRRATCVTVDTKPAIAMLQMFPSSQLIQLMGGIRDPRKDRRPFLAFRHRVFSYARWVTDEGYPLLSLRRARDPRGIVLVVGPFYAAASVFRQPRVATFNVALDRTNQGDWKRFKTRTVRYGRRRAEQPPPELTSEPHEVTLTLAEARSFAQIMHTRTVGHGDVVTVRDFNADPTLRVTIGDR